MKNNKGFMLAEVVITSTIVLTALISFYTTFNKLYKRYEIHTSYYNIDGVYAIQEILNILLEKGNINKIITKMNLDDKKYIPINNDSLNSVVSQTSYNEINRIIYIYNIDNMYLVENSYNTLIDLKNNVVSKNTFKDYIDFIIKKNTNLKQNDETESELYQSNSEYLFIIEYKNNIDSDEYYYSYLEFGGPSEK